MAFPSCAALDGLVPSKVLSNGEERGACLEINPKGFHIRHPPSPNALKSFITPDDLLFETIHMGAAVVDVDRWRLVIDGLVRRPCVLTLAQIKEMPHTSVTAFHECYGSPLKPPTEAVWRIGNVTWTGVPLKDLLEYVQPLPEAKFVWSDGLDRGEFAGRRSDRYQKDLPLEKAMGQEILLAYKMNGEPLRKERGGPLRLVVPGWFGCNMTKWLCRLSLQPQRATSLFTTIWYNELDPHSSTGAMRPIWQVEPNSVIVSPAPNAKVSGSRLSVSGWAWCNDCVKTVLVSADGGYSWFDANVTPRSDFSWQRFEASFDDLSTGTHLLLARATSTTGEQQPLRGRRNHAHGVEIEVGP